MKIGLLEPLRRLNADLPDRAKSLSALNTKIQTNPSQAVTTSVYVLDGFRQHESG